MTQASGTVVNTRPRDQAEELSQLLVTAGFEVVEAPAIETGPGWDPDELRAVRADLAAGAYDWVVLPSQNAGRLLVESLKQARLVCGSATAQALGATPTLALDRFSARAALAAMASVVRPGQRILVPRAAEGHVELIDGLAALGARVHASIAYHTVAVEPSRLASVASQLSKRHVSAITVCSPSAINALLAGVGRETLLMARLVCLGETTAEAARQVGLRVDGMAKKTTMASLVEAVQAVLEAREVPA